MQLSITFHRGIRILSEAKKMTLEDVKAGNLSTREETADQFADNLIPAAILAQWDRETEIASDGALRFYTFLTAVPSDK